MQFLRVLRDRIWPEVRQTWPFWLFFLGPAVAGLLAWSAGQWLNRGLADRVRYFGTWLQLFGIALVAQGVRELRREFNRPTVLMGMRSRINAIIQSFKPRHLTIHAGAGSIGLSGSVATVKVGQVGSLTVEQRLENLEHQVAEARTEAENRNRKVDGKFSRLRGELSNEREQRREGQLQIQKKLDNVAVGGLHLDIIGLWWLLFATIATSVPDGVAWMLHELAARLP